MSPKISVSIFIPCFMDQLYPETGMSMVKILRKLGCEVHYNTNQTCCGQPAYNAGYFEEGQIIAKKFIEDFKGSTYIVCPSASCVGMVKNTYSSLLESDTNTLDRRDVQKSIFEFTEFLIDILKVSNIEGAYFPYKVTYHDSCSALRECNIKHGPRELLSNVNGLEFCEMKSTETCCGFGGTFAVKFEAISTAMGEQKIENALQSGAEYIASTDISCLMHIEGYSQKQGLPVKTIHIADLLASGW